MNPWPTSVSTCRVAVLANKFETELSTYPNEFLIPHRNSITRFEISGRHGFFCSSCQRTSQIFNIRK